MSLNPNNSFKQKEAEFHDFSNIKSLLQEKNLNPKEIPDLKYLLSLTINPNINNINLNKLLIYLLKYLNSETLPTFTEFFFQSCELGSLSIVEILLENNLDINSKNDLGETPLHIAVGKQDIELINLLIKYDPLTNIATYKDGLTVMNYAEILGDKNIIKLIKNLEEKNLKKKINLEIKDFIDNNMNEIENNDINNNDNSEFILNNINNIDIGLIQNFNGEKISIITDSDVSNSFALNNNLNNRNIINNSKLNYSDHKYLNTQTIVNESDYNEEINPSKEPYIILLTSTKINGNQKSSIFNNDSNKNSLKNSKKITETKLFSSSIKKKSLTNNINNFSSNPSYIQSLTTCTTTESPFIFTSFKSSSKKSKILDFITEINLPSKYSNNLIDNGFDNLDVLISQTKKGIALTYENLRDIGIQKPGERFKILIHLEEIANNFDFFLEKKIYNDNNNNYSNDENIRYFSLKKFLENNGFKNKFLNNFIEKGVFNVELLYIQMESKQPLNENILVNDFGINKNDANKIIIKLYANSRNYVTILKKKNKRNIYNYNTDINININKSTIMEETNNINNIKSCDMCNLF